LERSRDLFDTFQNVDQQHHHKRPYIYAVLNDDTYQCTFVRTLSRLLFATLQNTPLRTSFMLKVPHLLLTTYYLLLTAYYLLLTTLLLLTTSHKLHVEIAEYSTLYYAYYPLLLTTYYMLKVPIVQVQRSKSACV